MSLYLDPSVVRFAKLALYIALLVLPGGSLAVLLLWWLSRRREKPQAQPAYIRAWVWETPARALHGLPMHRERSTAASNKLAS